MISEHHTNTKEHDNHDLKEPFTVVEVINEIKEPVVDNMQRDGDGAEPVKRCCKVSEQTRCACHCCLRSWSLILNACEGCCAFSSAVCIFMSSLAIGCNKCLEQMDCDGH
jgi:hypothetical protein